jgi:tetratricopeptide (TPR) repeat protein
VGRCQRHFVRAAYLAPDQGLFWSNLAQAHRKLGDLPAAETAARRAVALDPSDLLARKLCGITLTEQHRYGEAVAVFAAHPPGAPRDHDYHCEYGQALYMLGRILESSRQFILSFTCKPDFVPAHARLSNAFARLGMHSEAAECLRTVELLQPWDAQALGNLVHQTQNACQWDRLMQDTARLHESIEHHCRCRPRHSPTWRWTARRISSAWPPRSRRASSSAASSPCPRTAGRYGPPANACASRMCPATSSTMRPRC